VQPYDKNKKVQYLNVNGVNQGEISFPFTLKWREISAGIVKLNAGINNIELESYWGYTYFDYLIVKPADESIVELKVPKKLVNPNATKEAKALMSYWLIFTVNTSFGSAGDLRFPQLSGSERSLHTYRKRPGNCLR